MSKIFLTNDDDRKTTKGQAFGAQVIFNDNCCKFGARRKSHLSLCKHELCRLIHWQGKFILQKTLNWMNYYRIRDLSLLGLLACYQHNSLVVVNG